MELFPKECGLNGEINGQTTDANGTVKELSAFFQYDVLADAVLAFERVWLMANFPERTRLTHVERFPDCSFRHHVMIRWIDGKMDSFSIELVDEVLLNPNNA